MALITMRETEFKKFFENTDTFATALLAMVLDEYGTEAFEWEPEALNAQLRDDFHITLPEVNSDKIWALIVAMTTNQFFTNPEIFLNTCKALAHDGADFSTFRPVTPEELAWGVTEVLLNNPPDQNLGNTGFSEEVASMSGMLLYQQGVLQAPTQLQFAMYPTVNPVEDIQTMFADDESMFAAAMSNQKKAADEVDAHVKELMSELKNQLDALPLTAKKAAGAVKAPAAG